MAKFTDFESEAKKQGLGGEYFRLQSGENKIRILTEAEPFKEHFVDNAPSVMCVGEKRCGYCKAGSKASVKIMLYVLDRADEEIKLATMPFSIFKQLGELARSSEWGFDDLPPYDVMITKRGEGKETRYRTDAGRNSEPLDSMQLSKLRGKKPVKDILAAKREKAMPPEPMKYEDFPENVDTDGVVKTDLPF